MTLLLVDLSNNNPGPIDFGALKRHGVYGLWHKVSEGERPGVAPFFTDHDWPSRSRAARIVGLHVGGYHFAQPDHGSAEREAALFVAHLGRVQRRDLRPVLDLEANEHKLSPWQLHQWCHDFLSHVHTLSGVRALTYTSPGFVHTQGWQQTFGTGAGLWLADWGPNDGRDHGAEAPLPWTRFNAHQFTSRGSVPGVKGHVDLTHSRARRRILAHPVRGLP